MYLLNMVEKKERKKRVTKQKQKQTQKSNVTVNINSNNKAPKRITRGTTTQSRFSPITLAPNITNMIQPNPQPQYNPNEFHTVNTMLKELHNEIANLKIHNPLQAPLIQQQGMEVEKILKTQSPIDLGVKGHLKLIKALATGSDDLGVKYSKKGNTLINIEDSMYENPISDETQSSGMTIVELQKYKTKNNPKGI
jgi:hypothetical protein